MAVELPFMLFFSPELIVRVLWGSLGFSGFSRIARSICLGYVEISEFISGFFVLRGSFAGFSGVL